MDIQEIAFKAFLNGVFRTIGTVIVMATTWKIYSLSDRRNHNLRKKSNYTNENGDVLMDPNDSMNNQEDEGVTNFNQHTIDDNTLFQIINNENKFKNLFDKI